MDLVNRTWRSRFSLLALLCLLAAVHGRAQFSPGDLSRAHASLEGSTNCTRCHEIGREIGGAKCLACHDEIAVLRREQRGYHGKTQAKPCVECHKEHLGRDARTMKFDSAAFDHAQAGFALDGKHAQLRCVQCHTAALIKDAAVVQKVREYPHRTFLGLKTSCESCHRDPHEPKSTKECSSCHTTRQWAPAVAFNHTATKFPLTGKHAAVECRKCHAGFGTFGPTGVVRFATKTFGDCSPCHATPHRGVLNASACSSCHTPEGWLLVSSRKFNHAGTDFPLRGRHAAVKCEQCHGSESGKGKPRNIRPKHERCTDCHTDTHNGAFAASYKNDCAACHTEQGFIPSTFTLARHGKGRFVLSGAHVAVPCERCHRPSGAKQSVFAFSNTRCSSCHDDYHKGQFRTVITRSGCETCHGTDTWKAVRFDHDGTGFTLSGRHTSAACSKCHPARNVILTSAAPAVPAEVRTCRSCHNDTHGGQFAVNGATDCARCHRASGWKDLVFDHERHTAFALTGAHKTIACSKCHHTDPGQPASGVRYKPLDSRCESCHAAKH